MAIHPELFELVDQASYWPSDRPVDNRDIGIGDLEAAGWTTRAWRFDLCRDSTLSIRRNGPGDREPPFNGVAIPIYYSDDPARLREVQTLMCALAYDSASDERLTNEDGRRWLFSWISVPGTLWQLGAVQRVIHIFVSTGDARSAHAEAKRLDAIVENAYQKLVEARVEAQA